MHYYKKTLIAQSIRAQAAPIVVAIGMLVVATFSAQAQTSSPAAPANATVPEASLPYTVKPKDKLIVLSADLLMQAKDWPEVARFNRLKNPNQISPGQVINIPTRLMKSQAMNGKVVSTFGDVQLAGQPLTVGAAVAEGARLQTAANSSAVIELGDGSRVTLLPNTLAELVTSRNYAMRDAGASGSTKRIRPLNALVLPLAPASRMA